jgi:hypothetical protein
VGRGEIEDASCGVTDRKEDRPVAYGRPLLNSSSDDLAIPGGSGDLARALARLAELYLRTFFLAGKDRQPLSQ